jgi:hypothetical protein
MVGMSCALVGGMNKHWQASDFVVTHQSEYNAHDGRVIKNRYGYCAKCTCDMQELDGTLSHYKSHGHYKRAGQPIISKINQ